MNFHDISWSLDWFADLICEFWRGLREKCEALEGSHTNVFICFKTTKSSRQVIDPIDLIDLAQVAQARVVAVPLIHLSGTWGRNDHWQFERTIVSSSEKLWDVLSKTLKNIKTHLKKVWIETKIWKLTSFEKKWEIHGFFELFDESFCCFWPWRLLKSIHLWTYAGDLADLASPDKSWQVQTLL